MGNKAEKMAHEGRKSVMATEKYDLDLLASSFIASLII